MKLYKYAGPDIVEKSFAENDCCTFKCSYPTYFNDPYELFLTIDFNQRPELLAFYKEVVGDLPMYPTTCFSKSPAVIPMWAHYAHNHRGVVVELDELKLKNLLPNAVVKDVDYRNTPTDNVMSYLERSFIIGKPRYFMFLQQSIFHSAYFTKLLSWEYEKERRLVVDNDDIVPLDEMMLLRITSECVTSLICGVTSSVETKSLVKSIAKNLGADYYEMRIGKTGSEPFFVDEHMHSYTQKKPSEGLSKVQHAC